MKLEERWMQKFSQSKILEYFYPETSVEQMAIIRESLIT